MIFQSDNLRGNDGCRSRGDKVSTMEPAQLARRNCVALGTKYFGREKGLENPVEEWYYVFAFVALVTPLDSIEGAASRHLRPLLLYGWRRSRSTNSLQTKEVDQ